MRSITKRIYLEARKCLRRGWFARNLPDSGEVTEVDQFYMDQGIEVGERARECHPGGVFVEWTGLRDTVSTTERLMKDPSISAIFEATFHIDGYTTRADVLRRHGNGWKIMEIKSSLSDPEVSEELLDDLSYTVMVATRCGVNVTAASLLQIRRTFRLGMPLEEMFGEIDLTEIVRQRMPLFACRWAEIRDATEKQEPPEATLSPDCPACPYCADRCIGKGIEHPVWELPRVKGPQLAAFFDAGILDLRDIPADFPLESLTDQQHRVKECVVTEQSYVSSGLKAALDAVRWPVYYLDFETVSTGVPLYADVAPWTQHLTQYSIHRCEVPGVVDGHCEYLADSSRDCRRELAERLIGDLGTRGTILAYHTFESARIGELIQLFPDLTESLAAIKARLIDLLAILREHYYHPAFHGSFSIKTVLPVLVPRMSYSGLAIADGGAATVKFAKMAQGRYSTGECEVIRRNLLTYCGQDTLAMVEVHRALWNYVSSDNLRHSATGQ